MVFLKNLSKTRIIKKEGLTALKMYIKKEGLL